MRNWPLSKTARNLIIAALYVLTAGLFALAIDLIAADIQDQLEPHRNWIWIAFIVALVATFSFQLMKPSSNDSRDSGYHGSKNYNKIRRQYLTEIVKQFKYLPLRGIDFKSADACTQEEERLCLADVYIAMDVKARSGKMEGDDPARQLGMSGKEDPLPALEAFVKNTTLNL